MQKRPNFKSLYYERFLKINDSIKVLAKCHKDLIFIKFPNVSSLLFGINTKLGVFVSVL